ADAAEVVRRRSTACGGDRTPAVPVERERGWGAGPVRPVRAHPVRGRERGDVHRALPLLALPHRRGDATERPGEEDRDEQPEENDHERLTRLVRGASP